MEPPGYGFSLLVICMAGPAYLVARNTLAELEAVNVISGDIIPGEVRSHCRFELGNCGVEHRLPRTSHCGISKEHVQPTIQVNCLIYNIFHTCFVCCVELFWMHIHFGIETIHFSFVGFEVIISVVANEDSFGFMIRKLMGSSTAYPKWRVAACCQLDYYLVDHCRRAGKKAYQL